MLPGKYIPFIPTCYISVVRPAVILFAACIGLCAQDEPVRFGTTVVLPAGLRGQIYHIRRGTAKLPDFEKLKPRGTIYTSALDIVPQDFRQGFPGVTRRMEWFAIDYAGRFWISRPGRFNFSLTSDDGAKLYIDDQLLIDNDGQHPPLEKTAEANLIGGIHQIRVSYFQGPRLQVALILQIAEPGEPFRVFSTDEFKPPEHPETWPYPDPKDQPKKP